MSGIPFRHDPGISEHASLLLLRGIHQSLCMLLSEECSLFVSGTTASTHSGATVHGKSSRLENQENRSLYALNKIAIQKIITDRLCTFVRVESLKIDEGHEDHEKRHHVQGGCVRSSRITFHGTCCLIVREFEENIIAKIIAPFYICNTLLYKKQLLHTFKSQKLSYMNGSFTLHSAMVSTVVFNAANTPTSTGMVGTYEGLAVALLKLCHQFRWFHLTGLVDRTAGTDFYRNTYTAVNRLSGEQGYTHYQVDGTTFDPTDNASMALALRFAHSKSRGKSFPPLHLQTEIVDLKACLKSNIYSSSFLRLIVKVKACSLDDGQENGGLFYSCLLKNLLRY